VKVKVSPDRVEVEGPKGKLATVLPPGVRVEQADGALRTVALEESRRVRAFHGLARSLVANAVEGVAKGFAKTLDIVGIGYRAQVEGDKLVLTLGYSHPIEYKIPSGIKISVEKNTRIVITGADRQLVGQTAAEIRGLRAPDPYKQKGIRYVDEVLKKKAGKAGKTQA
jgi:large subunit ribosomal protein L6